MASPSDLQRSERLIWSGAPKQGLLLRRVDVFQIPFFVLWIAFSCAAASDAITNHQPWFARMFTGFFLAFGIYGLVGQYVYDLWERRRTSYGVTTDRAIIEIAGPFPSMRSIDLRTATDITLTEYRDGTGTIEFGRPVRAGRALHHPPKFERIPNAAGVFDLVRGRVAAR